MEKQEKLDFKNILRDVLAALLTLTVAEVSTLMFFGVLTFLFFNFEPASLLVYFI